MATLSIAGAWQARFQAMALRINILLDYFSELHILQNLKVQSNPAVLQHTHPFKQTHTIPQTDTHIYVS